MRKIVIAASLVIGILAVAAGARAHRRSVERRMDRAQAETAILREKMRDAYRKRGALVREWTAGTPLAKEAELRSLLVENDGLDLVTQPELDRYDFVQEQLNRKVGALLADRKDAAKKPKDWEKTEREVAAARAAYAKRTIEANRENSFPKPIPVFKAEAALSP